MTSKLKCPYCSADLESTTGGWEYGCTNTECQSAGTLCGTKELWAALIHTKKQLDRAKWWLKEIVENHRYTPITTAEMALKELDDDE